MHKFEQLLQTEMNRKQFLKAVGASLLAIFGVPALLRILSGPPSTSQLSGAYGYGEGNYGGLGDPASHESFSR